MGEFTDKERPIARKLRSVLEKYRYDIPALISSLKKLIDEDLYYLKTYIYLSEILENEGHIKEAEEVLLETYKRAMELIKGNDGKLTDRLSWKHETNKHIIKAILETGIMFWEIGEIDKALETLKMLYKLDPENNMGIKYYILAILEGMGFENLNLPLEEFIGN